MSQSKLNIIIAEDNELLQDLTSHLVKKLGHVAHPVYNGEEAVAALTKRPYDLVLMDCQMPVMNGYTATSMIRKLESNHQIPIVALTATDEPDQIKKCLDVGMTGYLAKPVAYKDLSDMIKSIFKVLGDAPEPIDVSSIAMLKELSSPERPRFLEEKVEEFLDISEKEKELLNLYFVSGQLEDLIEVAHRFRGCCGVVGAQNVEEICWHLEKSHKLCSKLLESLLDQFSHELDIVQTRLKNLI